MGDAQHSLLLPPSDGSFTPATPSGLTPNTRSEAEAALSHNSIAQTDSAAPSDGMYPFMGAGGGNTRGDDVDDGVTEAQKAYHRPGGPIRTGSTNYETAVREAHKSSVSSNMSTDTTVPESITRGGAVASPTSMTTPFPPPGQGVVPLHTGVGTSQGEAVKRAKARGMSLGELGRQQSWNEQDFKHILSANLMGEVKGDAGYGSGTEGKR